MHAGWNWQSDALVFWIEGDVNIADIDGDFTFANGDEFTTDVQFTGSLRARLGFAMNRALIYATGGLSAADVELGAFNFAGAIREEDNETYLGFTVGGGLEYAFTDALSARVEYRYTDLGEENFNWATSFPGFNGDYDVTFHAIQAGLTWHFEVFSNLLLSKLRRAFTGSFLLAPESDSVPLAPFLGSPRLQ